jgi:hypothetical protein
VTKGTVGNPVWFFLMSIGNFKDTFVVASYLLTLCQVLVPSPALGRVSVDDTGKRQMLKL